MVRFGQNIIFVHKNGRRPRDFRSDSLKRKSFRMGLHTAQFLYKNNNRRSILQERLSSNSTYGVLQLYGQSGKILQTQFLGARLCGEIGRRKTSSRLFAVERKA